MAINSCTLDGVTINAFCGPRRGIVLTRLIAELRPPIVQPTGNWHQSIRNDSAIGRLIAQQRPHYDIDAPEPMVYEQPWISVKVELLGVSGIQTQEANFSNTDIVIVTELTIGKEEPEITVNISDFNVN